MSVDPVLANERKAVFRAAERGVPPRSLYGRLTSVRDLFDADDADEGDRSGDGDVGERPEVTRNPSKFEVVRNRVANVGGIQRDLTATLPGRALELGCGTGRLLEPLASEYGSVVGLEASPRLLAATDARPGVAPVAGDPLRPPLTGPFGPVVCLGHLTARLTRESEPRQLFETIYDLLAPGGVLVFDAPMKPRPLFEDPWVDPSGRYRVDRTVIAGDVGPDSASFAVEYEFTDTGTGTVATVTDDLRVRLYDLELVDLLKDVGFGWAGVVETATDSGDLRGVARRPAD